MAEESLIPRITKADMEDPKVFRINSIIADLFKRAAKSSDEVRSVRSDLGRMRRVGGTAGNAIGAAIGSGAIPGNVTDIEVVETVNFDGITAAVTLRYRAPSPIGSFWGVQAWFRMPDTSTDVPVDAGFMPYQPDEDGWGMVRVVVTQPAAGDRDCQIWLSSMTATATNPLDEGATPSVVVEIPAATPVGETPLADSTDVAATFEIKDGRVLVTMTGTAPEDGNFAGVEVFIEIPKEDDVDPENITLPGQLYPQGWHFSEESQELDPKTWTAKLDVPVPPMDYLESLVDPKVKWVIYALSRSWGYANRLVRLTALAPPAPAGYTPFATITLDFTDYLSGIVDDGLGNVTVTSSAPPVKTWLANGDLRLQALRTDTPYSGYAPPYIGSSAIPTINPEFQGVVAFWEPADDPKRPYASGQMPYTGTPADPPPDNLGEVDVIIPRGYLVEGDNYLLLASYGERSRQPYKDHTKASLTTYWTINITSGELSGNPSDGVAPNPPSGVGQRVVVLGPLTWHASIFWTLPSPIGSTVGYEYELAYGDSVTPPGADGDWIPAGSVYGGFVREVNPGAPPLPPFYRDATDVSLWSRVRAFNERGERGAWVYSGASALVPKAGVPVEPTQSMACSVAIQSPPGHPEAYQSEITIIPPIPATGAVSWQARLGFFYEDAGTTQEGDWRVFGDRIPISQESWTWGAWPRPLPEYERYAKASVRLVYADGTTTDWVDSQAPLPLIAAAPAPPSTYANNSLAVTAVVDGVPSYGFIKRAIYDDENDWAGIYWIEVDAMPYLDEAMTTPDSEEWIDLGGLDPRGVFDAGTSKWVSEQRTSLWKMEAYPTWWKIRLTPINQDSVPGTPVIVGPIAVPSSEGFDAAHIDPSTLGSGANIIDGKLVSTKDGGGLSNGNFAAGLNDWDPPVAGIVATTTDAYDGQAAYIPAASENRYFTQTVGNVAPGRIYRLQAYARENTNTTGSMYLQWLNAAGGYISDIPPATITGDSYASYTVTGTAPANAAKLQVVFFLPAAATSGRMLIDNVVLTVEEPTAGGVTRTAEGITVNLGDGMTIVAGKLTPLLGDRLVIVDESGQKKLTAKALTNLETWGLSPSYFGVDSGFVIFEAAVMNFLLAKTINLTGEMRINNSSTDAYIVLNASGAAFVKGANSVNISAGGIVITNGSAVLSLLSTYVIAEALQVKQGTTVCFTATSTLLQIQGELQFVANGGINFTNSGTVTGFTIAKVSGLTNELAAKAPLIYSGDQTVNEKLAELDSRISALE
jgi:hypothetical protein